MSETTGAGSMWRGEGWGVPCDRQSQLRSSYSVGRLMAAPVVEQCARLRHGFPGMYWSAHRKVRSAADAFTGVEATRLNQASATARVKRGRPHISMHEFTGLFFEPLRLVLERYAATDSA